MDELEEKPGEFTKGAITIHESVIREGTEPHGDEVLLALLLAGGKDVAGSLKVSRSFLPSGKISDLEFLTLNSAGLRNLRSYAKVAAFIALTNRYKQQRNANATELIKGAAQIGPMFRFAADERTERFYLVMVDSAGNLIAWRKVVEGDQTKINFNPRLVIEMALAYKAYRVAFVHNHPDGNAKPSGNDHQAMLALYGICHSVSLHVLDSVIVAKNGYYSFANRELKPWADEDNKAEKSAPSNKSQH